MDIIVKIILWIILISIWILILKFRKNIHEWTGNFYWAEQYIGRWWTFFILVIIWCFFIIWWVSYPFWWLEFLFGRDTNSWEAKTKNFTN